MEEILKFKFDGNMYELYRDGQVLKCSKLVGTVHDFNLSEDEKNLVKAVYDEVIPSNEIVLIGNMSHDNNNFMHFIDKKSSMNIFYQIDGNRLAAPKKEALIYLNCTFNNQNEYLCDGNIKNTTQKFFKRIIKVAGKTVVVFVTSLALFVTPVLAQSEIDTDISPINTSSSVTLYKSETPKKSEISVKEIEDLIKGNKNLSVEEKELALSCPEFFKENSKLMDRDLIKSRLSNLETNYHKEKHKYFVGTYRAVDDSGKPCSIMDLYNTTDFEATDKAVWTHELGHLFQNFNFSMQALSEFLNNLMNNEYFGKDKTTYVYDQGYRHIYDYGCALLEILDDPEFVRELYSKGDKEALINRLTIMIPDVEMAYQTLGYFDTLNINFLNAQESEEVGEYFKDVEKKLKTNLKKYYEAKTKKPIGDNFIMLYYLDRDRLTEIVKERCELTHDIDGLGVNNYKKYVNVDGLETNHMKVMVYQDYFEGYHYLTAKEILQGVEGLDYDKESDIDFEKMPDGTYKVPTRHLEAFKIALDSTREIILEENTPSLSM